MLSAGLISADICITKQRKIDSTLKELRRKRGKILQNSAVDEAIKTITSLQEILTAGPEQLIRFDTDLFETLDGKNHSPSGLYTPLSALRRDHP